VSDDCGVCAGDVPPLLGEVLTGTMLTLSEAVARLERGEEMPELTQLQRRMVEEFASRA
jgi:hypothetical protein